MLFFSKGFQAFKGGGKLRSPIRMLEVEEESREEIRSLVEEIVRELSEYLKGYVPEKPGITKHSIMGPVGKLLSVMESGRFDNKDALVGYLINIHNNFIIIVSSKSMHFRRFYFYLFIIGHNFLCYNHWIIFVSRILGNH